jgi:hypothetical protein
MKARLCGEKVGRPRSPVIERSEAIQPHTGLWIASSLALPAMTTASQKKGPGRDRGLIGLTK